MRDNHDSGLLVKEKSGTVCEFLWGADEIGRAIGRNARWVVSRVSLLRELGARFAMSTIELPGDAQFVASGCTTSLPKSSRQEGVFARVERGARGFSSSKNARNASRPGQNQGDKK